MKTLKQTTLWPKFLFAFILAVSLTLYSCEGEEDSGGGCEDALLELSDKLTERSNVYSANPTESNCNSVRTAALNLINKATSCGYGSLYAQQTEFWVNLDCSDGTSGGGGNGGGGNSGGNSGNVIFWTQSDLGCGNITVNLNGSSGLISSYYSSGAPSCGASGCANFTLPTGSYSFTASCSGKNWNGNVTVTSGGCFKMKLTN